MILHNADCLDILKTLPDNSIDAIITDPPYGLVYILGGGAMKNGRNYSGIAKAPSRDEPLAWDLIWVELFRIGKEKCPIVLFGQNPFSSDLIQSARKYYRYQWVWEKNTISNFLRPKERPLLKTQDILVFSKKPCPNYYPQMELREKPYNEKTKGEVKSNIYSLAHDYVRDKMRTHSYPKNVLHFKAVSKPKPFEKPLDLMKYLVNTYSKENDVVLDFTAGTFTTGLACKELNREFIGIERNKEIFEIGKERLENN